MNRIFIGLLLLSVGLFSSCNESSSSTAAPVNGSSKSVVIDKVSAESYVKSKLPPYLKVGSIEFEVSPAVGLMGQSHVQFKYKVPYTAHEDLYEVNREKDFYDLLVSKGWDKGFYLDSKGYSAKRSPYRLITKSDLSEGVLYGHFKGEKTVDAWTYGAFAAAAGLARLGKPLSAFDKGYIDPEGSAGGKLIDEWISRQRAAKKKIAAQKALLEKQDKERRAALLAMLQPGKKYIGSISTGNADTRKITLEIKQNEVGIIQAKMTFAENSDLYINLQGKITLDKMRRTSDPQLKLVARNSALYQDSKERLFRSLQSRIKYKHALKIYIDIESDKLRGSWGSEITLEVK